MKYILCVLVAASHTFAQSESSDTQEQAAAAVKILNDWDNTAGKQSGRYMHIVCWTPADRPFPADYQPRLSLILKDIQEFYAREMKYHGFGDRSFNLQLDSDRRLVIHSITGKQPTSHYNKQSGREIREECIPVLADAGINANDETIVIFCNLAEWDEKQLKFVHNSPYYASGTNRSGTAWQLDSPELAVANLSLKQPIIQDGQYGRISLGKHNSIFIGGIAHEVGHSLGLPHITEFGADARRGTALMGSGNRTYGDELRGEGNGTKLTFAHALRLASHPQFSESVKGLTDDTSSKLSDLQFQTKDKHVEITGHITGEPPIYGLVAYFDPEGNGDYNATAATAVPEPDGTFRIRTDAYTRGKPGEFRLVVLHCNGSVGGGYNRAKFKCNYTVTADGIPDFSAVNTSTK